MYSTPGANQHVHWDDACHPCVVIPAPLIQIGLRVLAWLTQVRGGPPLTSCSPPPPAPARACHPAPAISVAFPFAVFRLFQSKLCVLEEASNCEGQCGDCHGGVLWHWGSKFLNFRNSCSIVFLEMVVQGRQMTPMLLLT